MAKREFRIAGSVVDAATGHGVSGLRIEAWSTDAAQHEVYGTSTSDEVGRFLIAASVEFPPPSGSAVVPATLKVFQDNQALKPSGNVNIPNIASADSPIRLQVTAVSQAPEESDKFTLTQALNAIDFVRLSDFRGIIDEARDRFTAGGATALGSLKSALSGVQLKPIGPPAVRTKDVIGQDTATARTRLASNNITVHEVKEYQPGVETLGTVTSLPRNLRAGDKVDVYQQDGVVRAYKVIPAEKPTNTATAGDVNRLASEMADVRAKAAQVDDLRAQLSQRDATIKALQSDLAAVKAAHEDLAGKLKPERLAALEESVRRLQGHT